MENPFYMYHTAIIKALLLLVTITIQPDGFSLHNGRGELYTCGKNLKGYHINYTNKIGFCSSLTNPEEKASVEIHELGHYVYFSELGPESRKQWETIFATQRADQTTAHEVFAEYFRMGIQNNVTQYDPEDDYDKKKERFMKGVFRALDRKYPDKKKLFLTIKPHIIQSH